MMATHFSIIWLSSTIFLPPGLPLRIRSSITILMIVNKMDIVPQSSICLIVFSLVESSARRTNIFIKFLYIWMLSLIASSFKTLHATSITALTTPSVTTLSLFSSPDSKEMMRRFKAPHSPIMVLFQSGRDNGKRAATALAASSFCLGDVIADFSTKIWRLQYFFR